MAKRGTCAKCGKENTSLPGFGLCWKCYGEARKDKEAKVETKPAGKVSTLPGRAAQPPAPGFKAAPAPKQPAPSNGNGLFPPLTIQFEERDNALVDALEAEAIRQRRTPAQHILYLLERHYGLTP